MKSTALQKQRTVSRDSSRWISIFLVLSSAGLLGAQDIRWEPRADILPYTGHELSWNEKAELAFIVSGVSAEALPAYVQRLQVLAETARINFESLSDYDKADQLLQYLYQQKTLVRYEASQTRLDLAFDRGIYNCVSSALLYFLVADYLGLKLEAVGTRDHAFCIVYLADREVDVETTTYLGFDPGKKREFHDSFGKLTGFSYVPASNYRDRNRLDFKGLVGLLIQNLMAASQERRDNVAPFGLAIDRLALEGSADARNLVEVAFKNYISDLGQRRNYDKALSSLDDFDKRGGAAPVSSDLRQAMVNNKVVELVRSRQLAEARATMARYAQSIPTPTAKNLWENLAYEESGAAYTQAGYTAAASVIATAQSRNEIDKKYADQLYLQFISREINAFGRSGKWQQSLDFLNGLSADLRVNSQVADMFKLVTRNIAVEYHNRFASLMNAEKKTEAAAVIEEGLSKVPDSDILLRDKAALAR